MDTSINRIHLITRKDIANIQQAYGLQEAQYHKDESTSNKLWVNAMNSKLPSPVLLYKPQGELPGADWPHLRKNDFALVFQHHCKQKC